MLFYRCISSLKLLHTSQVVLYLQHKVNGGNNVRAFKIICGCYFRSCLFLVYVHSVRCEMDQQLFNIALQAIVDTAKQAYIEGYNQCLISAAYSPEEPSQIEEDWQNSSVKAACDRMIQNLRGK
ncbi:hypothetical protein bas24_0063 [Escherichia phage SeppeHuegi]|nr:hypothetical protein bas24_0063 [Escherichia phage SeppeHuegi]